jgi:PTS system galactitol-specific IIB component
LTAKNPKIILVACGRAIASSRYVAQTIKKILLERGIPVETIPCTLSDVPKRASEADLVVSTTKISEPLDIPVIVTLAFLTGMGKDRVVDQIASYLK